MMVKPMTSNKIKWQLIPQCDKVPNEDPLHYSGTGRGLFITNCWKNQIVTAALYVQRMERVKMTIQENRPNRQRNVLLLHNNARPHIANMTKEVIQTHGWEVLPHPPYSPDLTPTDFHLFRLLSNAKRGISFNNDAKLKA